MKFAYYRVSTSDQSIEGQRAELGFVPGPDALEYFDEGVSGVVIMRKRQGFAQMLAKMRSGDSLHVAAVDRLGRDAIDVQQTVRSLIDSGIEVHVNGLGVISRGVGEIILAVLAQVADLERRRIAERVRAGVKAAKASLAATGKTHHGKASLGRKPAADAAIVALWRRQNNASTADTAEHFGISVTSVKRYIAEIEGPGEKGKRRDAA